MHEREYEKLKKRIKTECQAKLDAIEMVWKMSGKPHSDGKSRPGKTLKGALVAAVRGAVARLNGTPFNVRDIEVGLIATGDVAQGEVNRTVLSVILKRMYTSGTIDMVEAGSGRRATLYKIS